MRVTISDELADVLEQKAAGTKQTVDEIAEALIVRTIEVGMRERYLIIRGKVREELEGICGKPITDAKELVKQMHRLGSISFGHVRLKLTVKQMEEMRRRADKRSMKVADLIAEIAHEMEPMFFDVAGGFGVGYSPAGREARRLNDERVARDLVVAQGAIGEVQP